MSGWERDKMELKVREEEIKRYLNTNEKKIQKKKRGWERKEIMEEETKNEKIEGNTQN